MYVYEDKAAAAAAVSSQRFDARSYVDKMWASKVLPAVTGKAADAATLLKALRANPKAASVKYGHQSGTGSPYAFLVKGTGTVTKVDTSAPTGPVTVRLDGNTKPRDLTIFTGPVLPGTALRDAVGFIDFSQFTNQIDYAAVGTELNNRVKREVLAPVKPTSLKGQRVQFAGAFSLLVPGVVTVVPTTLRVLP